MSYPRKIVINDREIKVDKVTQFISVTDLGYAVESDGGKDFVSNWLRSPTTLEFILEWEKANNPSFNCAELEAIRVRSGTNAFRISVGELIEAGSTGVIIRGGKNGGTYCSIDWAIHFASWLSPRFYLQCIQAYRRLTHQLYGSDEFHRRFRWELIAES